ncbi:hypothetical protein B0I35DRAFT_424371 [Stachybotrys elegans]|uniref:Uncharacterized protein n=1 Tax=Stachybotrys elegans TaxID=80388 RepID=A0A8K0SX55_9HYPO|nr:hypothetical protein B0I35DRAFT_424371 [Stachybotrys elegans]
MADETHVLDLLAIDQDIFQGKTEVADFSPLLIRRRLQDEQVNRVCDDESMDESSKIDAIAEIRGWFRGGSPLVDAYLTEQISIAEAVVRITEPLEASWTTANFGTSYYHEEMIARTQRGYWTEEEALERWGPEEEFPKPTPINDEILAESQLWSLWYNILHAAKKLPWTDSTQQEKLVALVKAIKSRPDPLPPNPMTIPLKRNWIWSEGKLWSNLLMLGPSARECWNDDCGCGAGWTVPEQHAWTNVNAFVARLVSSGTAVTFDRYGRWAVEEALEVRPPKATSRTVDEVTWRTLRLTVAVIWIEVAGRYMFSQREKGEPGPDIDLNTRGKQVPWYGVDNTTSAQWRFWRRRFEQEAADEMLSLEVHRRAKMAATLIAAFEASGL